MAPPYYSEYPDTIKKNRIYFYRSKKTLKILPCRVININKENSYNVYSESIGVVTADRTELLSFDSNSRLFRNLMRLGVYREHREIKHVLKLLGLDPGKFMVYKPAEISRKDSDISCDDFKRLMESFAEDKDLAYKRDINTLLENPLPGTLGLHLHDLYKIVCSSGGMDNVINLQIWKKLFFKYMEKTNASYVMRTLYKKYLYEFELERRCEDDDEYNFVYLYRKGDHVTFIGKNNQVFCGEVVAMRNKGINVYYIQFLGWNKENNEWISEDILSKCTQDIDICRSLSAAPSKSSKANNLIDDPVTWEKHRHGSNFGIKAEDMMAVSKFFINIKEKNNGCRRERSLFNSSQEACNRKDVLLGPRLCKKPSLVDKRKKGLGAQGNTEHLDFHCKGRKMPEEAGSIKTLADVCEKLIFDGSYHKELEKAHKKVVHEKENLREDELSEYNFATYKLWKKEKRPYDGYF